MQVDAGAIKHHGLPESIAMVADALGFAVDEITETIEPMIARALVKTEYLEVAAGQAAGVHQIARGFAGGKEKIYMELQMYVGAPDPHDTIELTGTPGLKLTIPGGTHGDLATAAVVVNTIPSILAAPAGLQTSRDLPMSFFPPIGASLAAFFFPLASWFLPKARHRGVVHILLRRAFYRAIHLTRGGARRKRHADLIGQIERKAEILVHQAQGKARRVILFQDERSFHVQHGGARHAGLHHSN